MPQQRQNRFPVATRWKIILGTQDTTLEKERNCSAHFMPGWHLRMRLGRGWIWGEDSPSLLPCLWMPVEEEAPSANSSSGKIGDNLNLHLPSMERRDVPSTHMSKKSPCSSWHQRSCSSMGWERDARACHSPGLQSGASGLFGQMGADPIIWKNKVNMCLRQREIKCLLVLSLTQASY